MEIAKGPLPGYWKKGKRSSFKTYVVKSILDYSVAVGNPCKVVKKREKSPEQMVSVIMPTYNHGKFIAESIESVLDQTYRNLELIIIDNYSDDNTEEIVRSYNDERIQYFKFHNKGVIAAARNFGLKKISGDYVAFLDSDDIWHNNKLEKQLPHFHETDIIGVATNFTIISDTSYYRNSNLPKSRKGYVDFNYKNILNANHLITSSVVVRRNVLEQVGGFDESRDFCFIEDWELWLRMARSGSFRILEQPLLSYRVFRKKNRKSYQVAKRYLKILDKHVGLGFVKPSELAEPKASIYLHIASKLLEFDQKQSRKYYKEAFVNTSDIRKKIKSAVGMFISHHPSYIRKIVLLFLYKSDMILCTLKNCMWKIIRTFHRNHYPV